MAKEHHRSAAVNLSNVTKEANGSSIQAGSVAKTSSPMSSGSAEPPAEEAPAAAAAAAVVSPTEESTSSEDGAADSAAAKGEPQTLQSLEDKCCHEAGSVPPSKSKSPSSNSSSDSELKDMESCKVEAWESFSNVKAKDLPSPLSPEGAMSVRRCLWNVDRKEVDESLSREIKMLRQEESFTKSWKWNFDFDKEKPLTGDWRWKKSDQVPDFYKQKEYPAKKKAPFRYCPYERPSASKSLFGGSSSSSKIPPSSSSTLVTSTSEATSSLSSSLPSSSQLRSQSAVPLLGSSVADANAKDCLRFSDKGSLESSRKPESSANVQEPPTGSELTLKLVTCATSVTTCTVTGTTTNITSTSTTCTSTTTTVPSTPQAPVSTVSSESESNPRIPRTSSSGEVFAIPPTSFYSSPSVVPQGGALEERGQGPASSPGSSRARCKSPEKKKLRTSGGKGASPSPLLKYFR